MVTPFSWLALPAHAPSCEAAIKEDSDHSVGSLFALEVDNHPTCIASLAAVQSTVCPARVCCNPKLLVWRWCESLCFQVLSWALESPSYLAATAYTEVVWRSMPLLSLRLDVRQRQALCEVMLSDPHNFNP